MSVRRELIAELAAFDTATICNAIEMFELRPRNEGYANGEITAAFPDMPPAVGLACTATFRSGAPNSHRDPYGRVEELCYQLENTSVPTIVVCQDLDAPPVGATFGEVMCGIYKRLGAAGLITSGAGRDLSQVKPLGFPVFLGCTIAAHAYCHAVDVGVPVTVSGLTVQSQDLIHADGNGIAKIPSDIATELPDVAAEYMRCESLVLDATEHGLSVARDLLARRREMIDAISKLKQRVSRRSAIVG